MPGHCADPPSSDTPKASRHAKRPAERFHFAQPARRPEVYPSGCSGSPAMHPRPRVSTGAVVRCSGFARALRPTAAARPLADRAVIIGSRQHHHDELPPRVLLAQLGASAWSLHLGVSPRVFSAPPTGGAGLVPAVPPAQTAARDPQSRASEARAQRSLDGGRRSATRGGADGP